MRKCKRIDILIKRNSKIICSYDMSRARRKSLRARYAYACERARNFLRPEKH